MIDDLGMSWITQSVDSAIEEGVSEEVSVTPIRRSTRMQSRIVPDIIKVQTAGEASAPPEGFFYEEEEYNVRPAPVGSKNSRIQTRTLTAAERVVLFLQAIRRVAVDLKRVEREQIFLLNDSNFDIESIIESIRFLPENQSSPSLGITITGRWGDIGEVELSRIEQVIADLEMRVSE
ncbi:hypothetical protein AB0J28_17630 [Streptosporangium canum]|uniref:hypothetical protein n=1 Tax=Streptosporangium canum TaxID=324952 RepID=UPI003424F071